MTETTPTEEELDYKVLPADFYYESNSVDEPPARSSELPRDVLALDSSFGFDSGLRNNLHYVGDPEKPDDVALLFATGNCVHILKVATGQVSYLFGHNTGGIGSLTVHPSRNFLPSVKRDRIHTSSFMSIHHYVRTASFATARKQRTVT